MKIALLVADLSKFGGIQLYNRNLVTALERAGAEIIKVELMSLGIFSKISFAFDFFLRCALERPDFVICSHTNFSPLALLARILMRVPYSVSLYGIDVAAKKPALERLALRKANKIILIFKWALEQFRQLYPEIDRKRIFYLPSPVDGARFVIKEKPVNLLDKYGIKSGTRVILTVARLNASENGNKGYDRVIRALARVLKTHNDVKYVLIGQGDERRAMEELVSSLNITDHVIFAGAVSNEELVSHYNLADMYVMPSKREGFGIVFIEALACGVPVIAGQYSKSELMNGELGISVEPDDIGAITMAILQLLNKNAPAHYFDKNALRARTLAAYGIDIWNSRVKSFLELIAAPRSPV